MASNRSQLTATIPLGGTNSDVVTVPLNATLVGIYTPAALTGTAISFKASSSASGTPVAIKPDNVLYEVDVAADIYTPVDPAHFEGVQYITVVSNDTEVAAREFTLVFAKET